MNIFIIRVKATKASSVQSQVDTVTPFETTDGSKDELLDLQFRFYILHRWEVAMAC